MQKTSLVVAVALATTASLAHAEVYDARAMGRGGVGLTMGEYNQAIQNPALLNRFDANDEFSFGLNVGAFASDEDGMIDDVDTIGDDLDDLEACGVEAAKPGSTVTCSPAELKASLAGLDQKVGQIGLGAALMVGVPNNTLPAALVVRSYADAGVQFNLSDDDVKTNGILDDIADGPAETYAGNDTNNDKRVDQDDLQSAIQASAIGVSELGFMFAREMEGFELGATLKYQKIELFDNTLKVSDFEGDDVVDEENNYKEHTSLNVDLGLLQSFGADDQFTYAMTIENLIPQDFKGTTGSTFSMNPVPVAAVGYHSGWVKAEASMDLNDRGGYGLLGSRKYARAGVELSAGRHAHLRLGYSKDLNNEVSSLMTLGLGITPWDRANLDLAVQQGEGETYGVALQLGFKI